MNTMQAKFCRFCSAELARTFVDLGVSPLANDYLRPEQLAKGEAFFPLHAMVCETCWLVQLSECQTPDRIFNDEYAYFSSYSDLFLRHAKDYAAMAIERFRLGPQSQVIEVASNDGYLLQYFARSGVPVLGIDPARNVAEAAEKKGVPTLVRFFDDQTAKELVSRGTQADLLIGNNVLAHVPGLNKFVAGLKIALKPDGVLTMEFPHLLATIQHNYFDTVYHEHFSYFSLLTAERVFAAHGLTLFDVEEISTHGGSLRIFGCHPGVRPQSERFKAILQRERDFGLDRLETYTAYAERVRKAKRDLLKFLIQAKESGKSVAGYGAPAKASTLLNYCGVGPDLVEYVVDRSLAKKGRFLPGIRIPIYEPARIFETKPAYVLMLAWNLQEEIRQQMRDIREWGGQFVVPLPEARIVA